MAPTKIRRVTALLLLAACQPIGDDTIDRTYDPCAVAVLPTEGAGPSEIAAVEAAMRVWNEAASLSLGLAQEASGEGDGDDDAPLDTLEVRFERAPGAFRGMYDDEAGIVFVNRDIKDHATRVAIIAHEMGHAFGLVHVPREERPSLMNPGAAIVPVPTTADVEALYQLWQPCAAR